MNHSIDRRRVLALPGRGGAGLRLRWLGIVAPAGTPAEALQRFNKDLGDQLDDPDIAARILALGPVVEKSPQPQAMAEFLKAEYVRWSSLSREIGVLPE